ncbi:uncharacterized protein V1516DRAFT_667026 [Lipomyces oligophaga]|uniref:uncharacterized protein n=1 Tax=Lipomyces oligophaga TaxID=45792 RepID=UPI0034D004EA
MWKCLRPVVLRRTAGSRTVSYPPWVIPYLVFAISEAVFLAIVLAVVAYFIHLVRLHNGSDAKIPQVYVLLIVSSSISNIAILISTVVILREFRTETARISSFYNFRDENQLDGSPFTINIDNISSEATIWPFVFVISQISLAVYWLGLFIYIMIMTGGISTSCSIPNGLDECYGHNADMCHSYERACKLSNLIVVSCGLSAGFWISGTLNMFLTSAVTYHRRPMNDLSSIARIFRSKPSDASMTEHLLNSPDRQQSHSSTGYLRHLFWFSWKSRSNNAREQYPETFDLDELQSRTSSEFSTYSSRVACPSGPTTQSKGLGDHHLSLFSNLSYSHRHHLASYSANRAHASIQSGPASSSGGSSPVDGSGAPYTGVHSVRAYPPMPLHTFD